MPVARFCSFVFWCALFVLPTCAWAATSRPASRPTAAKERSLPLAQRIKTPRIALQLLSEFDVVSPGQTFWVGVHQTIKKEWHTYWRNPGDSGTAPKMQWQLPKGVHASPIHWPTPHKIKVAHLVNYGYGGQVVLLARVTLPSGLSTPTLTLQGRFRWLVCQEECIPGKGKLSLTIRVANKARRGPDAPQIQQALRALPRTAGKTKLNVDVSETHVSLRIHPLPDDLPVAAVSPSSLSFYPQTPAILHNAAAIKRQLSPDKKTLSLQFKKNDYFSSVGDAKQLKGLLVATWKHKGKSHERGYALYAGKSGGQGVVAQRRPVPRAAKRLPAKGRLVMASKAKDGGLIDFLARIKKAASATPEEPELGLWQALLFALLGGLLLNLMPCVFPVLSIKVMHFVEQADETSSSVRRHGFAFVAGVMLSFSLLAGALLLLRASGQLLGWGFQLQSPLFVWALLVLMFGMGLSLSGVFELGGSLMSVGEGLTHRGGYVGSFFTGVLATIVATPCTAPLMAPALGWALTQPTVTSLLVFNALGFGMALPYALFSLYPKWLRFLPKPGAWMERLKQVMAFALYGTAVWLLWVLGQQAGLGGVVTAMMGLLALAFAGWLFGITRYAKRQRLATVCAAFVFLVAVGWGGQRLRLDARQFAREQGRIVQLSQRAAGIAAAGQQQAFHRRKLDELLRQRKHVLLNMTAAWCISCKVNEKVALKQASVVAAMRKRGVYYLVGDWTNQDDDITRVLGLFKRSGVPLYVLFDGQKRTLEILPQLLSPGILKAAIHRLR